MYMYVFVEGKNLTRKNVEVLSKEVLDDRDETRKS